MRFLPLIAIALAFAAGFFIGMRRRPRIIDLRQIRSIRLMCLLLLCATVAPLVHAAGTQAVVTWTAPTAYTDGTAMPATDIAYYTVSWVGATPALTGSVQVPAGTLTTTITGISCGSISISATVTTTAMAAYPNATSGPAGPVQYASGVTCAPNPPGALAAH